MDGKRYICSPLFFAKVAIPWDRKRIYRRPEISFPPSMLRWRVEGWTGHCGCTHRFDMQASLYAPGCSSGTISAA